MSKPEPPLPSLDKLGKKIQAARGDVELEPLKPAPQAGLGMVWRMCIELVAGVAIGSGIGYALDFWFKTSPICLMIFFALGSVAGFITMLRTARGQSISYLEE